MYKSGQSFTLKYLNISFCIQIVIYFIIFNKLGQDKLFLPSLVPTRLSMPVMGSCLLHL